MIPANAKVGDTYVFNTLHVYLNGDIASAWGMSIEELKEHFEDEGYTVNTTFSADPDTGEMFVNGLTIQYLSGQPYSSYVTIKRSFLEKGYRLNDYISYTNVLDNIIHNAQTTSPFFIISEGRSVCIKPCANLMQDVAARDNSPNFIYRWSASDSGDKYRMYQRKRKRIENGDHVACIWRRCLNQLKYGTVRVHAKARRRISINYRIINVWRDR